METLYLVILLASTSAFECDFREKTFLEELLQQSSERSGSMDTDLFLWPDHTVYYMFQDSVSEEDREVIADTMKKIEEKTCLDFRETTRRRRKTLIIRTEGSYPYCPACYWFGILCPSKNGGSVRTTPWCSKDFYCPYVFQGTTTMSLRFNLPFCGRLDKRFEGLVLHELFHALGIIHTQSRPDRDHYVRVNMESVSAAHRSNYGPKCRHCHTFGLPYECDSVMHYGYKDFAAIGRMMAWFAPTMTSVDSSCYITPDGGELPTSVDWAMVNRAQRCPERP